MKNFINNWITPALIIIAIIGGLGVLGYFVGQGIKSEFVEQAEPLGSVAITNEYQATTTSEMSGTLVKSAEFNQLIKASTYGSVTLGSIVIASTTAHAMNIYNATSTDAIADGTYGTFITRISSLTPRGTYTYDIEMNQGLVVQLQAGFAGDYVLTFR